MAKATGVGGVFLRFKGDDQSVRDWYETHLGLDMSPYGTNFISGDQLTLVSFTKREDSDTPNINFRVDNLKELITDLKQSEVKIIQPIQEYNYGLFAQIEDPFGNKIEIWEPNEEEYKKMVKQEIVDYKKRKSTNK